MEEDKHGVGTGSRWNPTKEQISILEGLYKQGVRTPSAEQIQNITARLKVYGHIEGKNVFYWFQNHKARQRQKQKQEMVYYNQYLHKAAASASNTTVCSTTPLFNPSTGSNVICSPYYMTQHNTINYYPQYPKVPIPSVMKRKQKTDKLKGVCEPAATTYQQHAHCQQPFGIRHTGDTTGFSGHIGASVTSGETLELFPLHPTGILKENSTNSSAYCSEDSDTCGVEEGYGDQDQPFFDFFGHYGFQGG